MSKLTLIFRLFLILFNSFVPNNLIVYVRLLLTLIIVVIKSYNVKFASVGKLHTPIIKLQGPQITV
jgi:hypothetical protein